MVLLGFLLKVAHFYGFLFENFLKRARGVWLSVEMGAKESD